MFDFTKIGIKALLFFFLILALQVGSYGCSALGKTRSMTLLPVLLHQKLYLDNKSAEHTAGFLLPPGFRLWEDKVTVYGIIGRKRHESCRLGTTLPVVGCSPLPDIDDSTQTSITKSLAVMQPERIVFA